ncbi:MAG: prepilin-type N-terminal cleavage/methylation domain-containing protein [Coriobacteriia bacterium]|nr:prepilin-type N-terminal cleavage/methylation domain-containing protein [Coriobacteriia bacterium]
MKEMIKRIREERDGFTLAELLIVVAIIAVLVAIAIPIFNAQLENSREATDAANLRSAYAEVSAAALTNAKDNDQNNGVTRGGDADGSYTWTKEVELEQTQAGWQNDSLKGQKIGTVDIVDTIAVPGKKAKVVYTQSTNAVTISVD